MPSVRSAFGDVVPLHACMVTVAALVLRRLRGLAAAARHRLRGAPRRPSLALHVLYDLGAVQILGEGDERCDQVPLMAEIGVSDNF